MIEEDGLEIRCEKLRKLAIKYKRKVEALTAIILQMSEQTREDNSPKCPVCMSSWISVVLNCHHGLCKGCVEKIRKDSNLCPLCRATITETITIMGS